MEIRQTQEDIVNRGELAVLSWGGPPAELDAQGALDKLLRGKGAYEGVDARATPSPIQPRAPGDSS